jgi:hypothetical protein
MEMLYEVEVANRKRSETWLSLVPVDEPVECPIKITYCHPSLQMRITLHTHTVWTW